MWKRNSKMNTFFYPNIPKLPILHQRYFNWALIIDFLMNQNYKPAGKMINSYDWLVMSHYRSWLEIKIELEPGLTFSDLFDLGDTLFLNHYLVTFKVYSENLKSELKHAIRRWPMVCWSRWTYSSLQSRRKWTSLYIIWSLSRRHPSTPFTRIWSGHAPSRCHQKSWYSRNDLFIKINRIYL